jgi:hypothetical protein
VETYQKTLPGLTDSTEVLKVRANSDYSPRKSMGKVFGFDVRPLPLMIVFRSRTPLSSIVSQPEGYTNPATCNAVVGARREHSLGIVLRNITSF